MDADSGSVGSISPRWTVNRLLFNSASVAYQLAADSKVDAFRSRGTRQVHLHGDQDPATDWTGARTASSCDIAMPLEPSSSTPQPSVPRAGNITSRRTAFFIVDTKIE